MNRVGSFVTLRPGRAMRASGKGRVSTRVILSRGRVERRGTGRSVGEQATRTWRRWEFDAKKDRFSLVM